MNRYPPEFLLKVADAFVDEVTRRTDAVLAQAQQMSNREGFFESLRGTFAGQMMIGELKNTLLLAMKICQSIAQVNPQVKLDDGTTPVDVLARVHFQIGFLAMGQKYFVEAIKSFHESVNLLPTQVAYFDMALCYVQIKRIEDAIKAFDRCIGLDSKTESAIEAGKELARLGQI